MLTRKQWKAIALGLDQLPDAQLKALADYTGPMCLDGQLYNVDTGHT